MAIGDVTFYPNYIHYAGVDYSAEPSASGNGYACSGGETTGALYDLLDNKRSSVVTFDTDGESGTLVVNVDTTNDIDDVSFIIVDNHNLGTADCGLSFHYNGAGDDFSVDEGYEGTLGEALSANIPIGVGFSPSKDGIFLFLSDDPPTDNDFQITMASAAMDTYDADITIGEIAIGAWSRISIAPDLNLIETSNYAGVNVTSTLGGQKHSFYRFGERKSWNLTWSVLGEADKNQIQTVWNVTQGPRYPFWIDLGESATPHLYYVRFVQNSLQIRKLTSQAYEVSIQIESEV